MEAVLESKFWEQQLKKTEKSDPSEKTEKFNELPRGKGKARKQPRRFFKLQSARGGQCRIFAQTMTGNIGRVFG